jgi:hypothetical protein
LRICHKANKAADVAFIATVGIVGDQFRAMGWTQVRRGQCAVVGQFERPKAWWHARSQRGDTWGRASVQICVNLRDQFEYTWQGSGRDCQQGETLVGFKEETHAPNQNVNVQNLVD